MVRLGAWSGILLVLAAQCIVLAAMLWPGGANRSANRLLALLLLVIAGLLTPFILGYAGAYDAWPWLTFAPFAVPLAVGPLVYAQVVALARACPIDRVHWILPALQFGWQAVAFFLSPEAKDAFDAAVVAPVIGPLSDAAVLASMLGYGIASWRLLGDYQSWLDRRRRHRRPARRIRALLLLLFPLVAARAGYSLFEAVVRPTDYFDLFGYYLLLGAVGIAIGIDGWRQSGEATPAAVDEEAEWTARGAHWIATLRREQWWRDSDLSLDQLARRLGTNRAHVSRALSGHGGFAAVVGAIRAEAVADEIRAGRGGNLLATALACGFGSKASFNRAFRHRFGVAPSRYGRGSPEPAGAIQDD